MDRRRERVSYSVWETPHPDTFHKNNFVRWFDPLKNSDFTSLNFSIFIIDFISNRLNSWEILIFLLQLWSWSNFFKISSGPDTLGHPVQMLAFLQYCSSLSCLFLYLSYFILLPFFLQAGWYSFLPLLFFYSLLASGQHTTKRKHPVEF